MKRAYNKLAAVTLAVILGFSLGANAAGADEGPFVPAILQREESIMREGIPETFQATLFRWEGMVSLWYDAQSFVPAVTHNGVRFDLITNALSGPVSLSIEDIWKSGGDTAAALTNTQQDYEQNGWVCNALDTEGILPNFHFADAPVQGFVAQKDGQIAQVYLCSVASGRYLCTLRFPQEATEGWSTRMTQMLNTLAPLPGESSASI